MAVPSSARRLLALDAACVEGFTVAGEIESVQNDHSLQDRETRLRIIAAIQRKYTAPV
jgi:hypothetical protein